MVRNYWITTQWPPYVNEEDDDNFEISLQKGREKEAKQKLNEGDLIFIYELKTGPAEKGIGEKRKKGHGGIIALAKATSTVKKDSEAEWKYYDDGKRRWWKWYVETETVLIKKSIRRRRFNRLLGYDPNYTLRGFGKDRSGLKNVTKGEFCRVLRNFSSELYRKYCQKE